MSNEEFERRFNNAMATIIENQARFDANQARFDREMHQLQEAIAGLIQVARIHDEQIDRNSAQINELREGLSEQREAVNALIRIVEGHVTNHP